MRVFIINLEKDSERRLSILQQCKDLNIEAEIIPAVDGRTLSHNELEKSLIHLMLPDSHLRKSDVH